MRVWNPAPPTRKGKTMARLFAVWGKGTHPNRELLAFVRIHDLGKYNGDALGKAHVMAKEEFPDVFPLGTAPTKRKFVDRFKNVLMLEENKDRG